MEAGALLDLEKVREAGRVASATPQAVELAGRLRHRARHVPRMTAYVYTTRTLLRKIPKRITTECLP